MRPCTSARCWTTWSGRGLAVAARVTGIEVRLGAPSHLTPGHFREHFDLAARHTAAAGARLRVSGDGDPFASDAQGVPVVSVDVE